MSIAKKVHTTMMTVISPAKTFDFDTPLPSKRYSQPLFLKRAIALIKCMKKMSKLELTRLMNISPALAALNYDRYRAWHTPFTPANARPALFAFRGDVYKGLLPETLPAAGLKYAQAHLRILSGLYGMLRPLDLIQAYRLEMGTRLAPAGARSLYEYWQPTITQRIGEELQSQDSVLINLASQEYFKAIATKSLAARVITPVFKEEKRGQCRVISFLAKRARGLMSRFIINHALSDAGAIKRFRAQGYRYSSAMSTDSQWVFVRPHQAVS